MRSAPLAIATALLALVPALLVARTTPSYGAESFERNLQDPMLFRASAELALRGESPYDSARVLRLIEQRWHPPPSAALIPFAYPPTALPVLLVHAFGSEQQGYLCAVLGYGALMVFALLWAAAQLGLEPIERAIVVIACGWSGAMALNALLGQTGTLISALVFAYLALYRRAPIWAGVALGLMSIKPQYLLFVGLVPLIERRWRVVLSALATGTVLVLLVTCAFGVTSWQQWWHAALQPNPTLTAMGNWSAPFSHFSRVPVQTLQSASLWVLLAALLTLALALVLWQTHDSPFAPRPAQARLGLAVAWATFASPNTHPYDLTLWFAVVLLLPGRKAFVAIALALFTWVALAASLRAVLPLGSLALAVACVSVLILRDESG